MKLCTFREILAYVENVRTAWGKNICLFLKRILAHLVRLLRYLACGRSPDRLEEMTGYIPNFEAQCTSQAATDLLGCEL